MTAPKRKQSKRQRVKAQRKEKKRKVRRPFPLLKTSMTVQNYGTHEHVALSVATIHRATHVASVKGFFSKDFESGKRLSEAVMSYGTRNKIDQVMYVNKVKPIEDAYCNCCGKLIYTIGHEPHELN